MIAFPSDSTQSFPRAPHAAMRARGVPEPCSTRGCNHPATLSGMCADCTELAREYGLREGAIGQGRVGPMQGVAEQEPPEAGAETGWADDASGPAPGGGVCGGGGKPPANPPGIAAAADDPDPDPDPDPDAPAAPAPYAQAAQSPFAALPGRVGLGVRDLDADPPRGLLGRLVAGIAALALAALLMWLPLAYCLLFAAGVVAAKVLARVWLALGPAPDAPPKITGMELGQP